MSHGLKWFLERLDGVEDRGDYYMAVCPAHDDDRPSLSVRQGDDKVLVHCHAGCEFADVVSALETEGDNGQAALGAEEAALEGQAPPTPSVTITRTHRHSHGGLDWWSRKTQVERHVLDQLPISEEGDGVVFEFPGGQRKWRRPPKEIGWDADYAPPLWPFPPDEMPESVWIVEGESDCCTGWQLHAPTYAITKGAKAALSVEEFQALASRGVRHVTIVGDADVAGRKMREICTERASVAGLEVSVVNLEGLFDPLQGENDLNDLWQRTLREHGGDIPAAVVHCTAAIEDNTESYAYRYKPLSIEELLATETDDEEWLIPNLIHPGDKVVIFGPQKSYKTWVSLDLIRSLAEGVPFLAREDWKPEQRIVVGLVEEEGAVRSLAKRMSTLQLSEEARERVKVWHRTGFTFNDRGAFESISREVEQHGIQFLIFDPLQRMAAGIDENDATETALVWDMINELLRRHPKLTVCVIHHASKDEGRSGWNALRGSSRLAGEVDLGIMLRRGMERNRLRMWVDGRDIPQYLENPSDHIAIDYEVRMADEPTERRLTMNASDIVITVNSTQAKQGEASRAKIVEYLMSLGNDGATASELSDKTGLGKPTVLRHLGVLLEDEVVDVEERDSRGGPSKVYRYVQEG